MECPHCKMRGGVSTPVPSPADLMEPVFLTEDWWGLGLLYPNPITTQGPGVTVLVKGSSISFLLTWGPLPYSSLSMFLGPTVNLQYWQQELMSSLFIPTLQHINFGGDTDIQSIMTLWILMTLFGFDFWILNWKWKEVFELRGWKVQSGR